MTDEAQAKPAPAKKPADHQQKKPSAAAMKKQQEVMASFLAAGLDFTPFTIDAGDGIVWKFKPDTMPSDLARLRNALLEMENAGHDVDKLAAAFDQGIEAIRAMMVDEEQRPQFPAPVYGTKAVIFFLMHLIAGKTGFPTEA